jgi:hypothetical protein
MRDIIRVLIGGCLLYFAINWVADNPRLINKFRQLVNSSVDEAVDKSKKVL